MSEVKNPSLSVVSCCSRGLILPRSLPKCLWRLCHSEPLALTLSRREREDKAMMKSLYHDTCVGSRDRHLAVVFVIPCPNSHDAGMHAWRVCPCKSLPLICSPMPNIWIISR